MATHIAIVQPDRTVVVPVDEAQPGETVVIRIDRTEDRPTPAQGDDEYLTIRTADTPEKKERLIQQTLEWGRLNRAQLSEEELNFDFDDWMYDENGLPK